MLLRDREASMARYIHEYQEGRQGLVGHVCNSARKGQGGKG
jgi:hypothetical protein